MVSSFMSASYAQDWPATDPAARPCYLVGNFRGFALKNTENLQVYKGVALSSPTTWTPVLNTAGSNAWSTDNHGALCIGQALNLEANQTVVVVNQAEAGFLSNPLIPIILLSEEVDITQLPAAARISQPSHTAKGEPAKAVRIHPNPFTETCTVTYSLPQAEAITVELYTVTGKQVSKTAHKLLSEQRQEAGQRPFTFNGTHLPAGMYLLMVRGKNGYLQQQRVVKLQ